ncbi:hypothetical protein NL676_006140 [Syzygium grande]|nr:hypothetical protein NL676_006140 [Syzygium grande]
MARERAVLCRDRHGPVASPNKLRLAKISDVEESLSVDGLSLHRDKIRKTSLSPSFSRVWPSREEVKIGPAVRYRKRVDTKLQTARAWQSY